MFLDFHYSEVKFDNLAEDISFFYVNILSKGMIFRSAEEFHLLEGSHPPPPFYVLEDGRYLYKNNGSISTETRDRSFADIKCCKLWVKLNESEIGVSFPFPSKIFQELLKLLTLEAH